MNFNLLKKISRHFFWIVLMIIYPACYTQADEAADIQTNEVVDIQAGETADIESGEASGTQPDEISVEYFNANMNNMIESYAGNDGSANYVIPIEVPEGRNGLTPEITIRYNSNHKNGYLGVGWQINLGAIRRVCKYGVDYSENDYVVEEDAGLKELAIRNDDWGSNYYGAKIENDFTKYYFDKANNKWIATTRDGVEYHYGSEDLHRVANPDDPNQVFKWCLDKIIDLNGNIVEISYIKNENQVYPDEVLYGGNVNFFSTQKCIKFEYSSNRTDNFTKYNTKFGITTSFRLEKLAIFEDDSFNGPSILSYVFQYDEQGKSNTERTRLTSLKKCFSGEKCTVYHINWCGIGHTVHTWKYHSQLPANTLEKGPLLSADIDGDGVLELINFDIWNIVNFNIYSRSKEDFSIWDNQIYKLDDPISGAGDWLYQWFVCDLNGDGRDDLIQIYDRDQTIYFDIFISRGPNAPPNSKLFTQYFQLMEISSPDLYCPNWRIADIDGERTFSLVRIAQIKDTYGGRNKRIFEKVCWDNQSNQFYRCSINSPQFNSIDDGFSDFAGKTGDLNGDGITDFIKVTERGIEQLLSNRSYSDDFNFSIFNPLDHEIPEGYTYKDSDLWYASDINGDGITDLVMFDKTTDTVYVHFSTGNGKFRVTEFELPLNDIDNIDQLKDVNQDGNADLIFSSFSPSSSNNYSKTKLYLFLSDGKGNFRPTTVYSQGTLSPNITLNDETGQLIMEPAKFYPEADFSFHEYHQNEIIHYTLIETLEVHVSTADLISSVEVGDSENTVHSSTFFAYRFTNKTKNNSIPFVRPYVVSIRKNDGLGNTSTTNFDFSGGYYDKSLMKLYSVTTQEEYIKNRYLIGVWKILILQMDQNF